MSKCKIPDPCFCGGTCFKCLETQEWCKKNLKVVRGNPNSIYNEAIVYYYADIAISKEKK